jgi:hypothetical protein
MPVDCVAKSTQSNRFLVQAGWWVTVCMAIEIRTLDALSNIELQIPLSADFFWIFTRMPARATTKGHACPHSKVFSSE